ncbi:hypothetical protein ES707_06720 [subsurface metagenome]
MDFKKIGSFGTKGAMIDVKAGVVGVQPVISLTRGESGERVLLMNPRACKNLIWLLKEALLELRRMGVE